jgi:hypothetical protein
MPPLVRLVGLAIGSALAFALTARAEEPAEPLFRLVPADATAALAIEDFRGHAREFFGSPLAEGFRQLPVYKAWVASERFRKLENAVRRIEKVVGEKVSTLCDELLGDAVVLVLRIPPDGRPDGARGLLLTRVGNRALLDRLILGINTAQERSGELARLVRTDREGVAYWTREFRRADKRPREYYTVLDDNTFASSNAEDLIQGVIDRKAGKGRSLAAEPKFRRVRGRLPGHSALSLFAEPVFLKRVLASLKPPRRPPTDRGGEMVGRYLGALEYFGAALRWQDGAVLHTEEIVDPGRLDPWLRRWAAAPGEVGPSLRKVPATALAMASVHFDFNAFLDAIRDFVPGPQQPRLTNLILALDGLLLGRSLQAEILPRMGPGVLTYVEAPATDDESRAAQLSKVLVVNLGDAMGVSPALDNALRTYLALYALNTRHGHGLLQLESRDVEGRKVTALRPTSPFAFSLDDDRLILGSSTPPVAGALDLGRADATADNELVRLRAARFPEADSFACVDLLKLHQFVINHRAPLVERLAAKQKRPAENAASDLDQAVALMALFRQSYLTAAIDPDATAVHRTLGLIAREPAAVVAP